MKKNLIFLAILFSLILYSLSFASAILIPAWFNISGDIQNKDYLTNGLKAGYKFDDLKDNVLDSVTGRYNGTNSSIIKGETGIFNYSYNFSSSGSNYVSLPIGVYEDEGEVYGNYSYSIWVYWTAGGGDDNQQIIGEDYFNLFIYNVTRGLLEFDGGGGGMTSEYPLSKNSWNNIIITCEEKADVGNRFMYINGTLSNSGIGGHCTLSDSREIYIGRYKWSDINNWGGLMDELYFWNKTLNISEVSDISQGLTFSYYSPIYTATSLFPINNTITNQVLNYTADIYCSSGCSNATLYFKNSTDTIHSVFTDLIGIKNIELGNEVNLSAYGNDGIYDWYYELTDIFNEIATSEERVITIDTNAPYINWNDPITTTLTYTTNYTLDIGITNIMLKDVNLTIYNSTGDIVYNNFTADINLSTFQISDVIPLDEGENSIEVYVIDQVLTEIIDTKIIERDTTSPIIFITYPKAINYRTEPTELDYTYIETNCQSAWYSTDGGITNSTNVLCGENFTGLTALEGSNTWTIYMRDLVGNEGSSSIIFDYTPPQYLSSPIYQVMNSAGAGLGIFLTSFGQGVGGLLIVFVIISIIAIIGYAIIKAIPNMIKNWQIKNEK